MLSTTTTEKDRNMRTEMPSRHNTHAMAAMAEAMNPANTAAITERCTLWPWVIKLTYLTASGCTETSTTILQSTAADAPQPEALLPHGAELLRSDVFPATRFENMRADVRDRYKPQYRAFVMWRKARAADKSQAEMQPWVDYDPIAIDESVERWARPVGRYCGD
jgi:hypothetical protein